MFQTMNCSCVHGKTEVPYASDNMRDVPHLLMTGFVRRDLSSLRARKAVLLSGVADRANCGFLDPVRGLISVMQRCG